MPFGNLAFTPGRRGRTPPERRTITPWTTSGTSAPPFWGGTGNYCEKSEEMKDEKVVTGGVSSHVGQGIGAKGQPGSPSGEWGAAAAGKGAEGLHPGDAGRAPAEKTGGM